jgi:hypothetical protein
MLPAALALIARLNRFSVLFIGSFGPRGLASIVLGLVYLEHAVHLPRARATRGKREAGQLLEAPSRTQIPSVLETDAARQCP